MYAENAEHEIPREFSQLSDQVSRFLRWQECVAAGQHVADLCSGATREVSPSNKEQLLSRAVSLVCGNDFSNDELSWLLKYSADRLGW